MKVHYEGLLNKPVTLQYLNDAHRLNQKELNMNKTLFALGILALVTNYVCQAMDTEVRRAPYSERIESVAIATEDLDELQKELARELPKGRDLTLAEKRAIAEENRRNVIGRAGFKSFGSAPEKPATQKEPKVPTAKAPEAPQRSPRVQSKDVSSKTRYCSLLAYSEVDSSTSVDLSTAEDDVVPADYGSLRSVLDEELNDESGEFYSHTIEGMPVLEVQKKPQRRMVSKPVSANAVQEAGANELESAGDVTGNKSPRFKLGAKRENRTVTSVTAQTLVAKKSREGAVTEQSQATEKQKSPRAASPRSATLTKLRSPRGVSEPKIVTVNRTVLDVNETDSDRRFRKAYNMAIMDCTHKPQGDAEAIYKKMVLGFQCDCQLLIADLKETRMLDASILDLLGCASIAEFLTAIGCEGYEHLDKLLGFVDIEKDIKQQCFDNHDRRLAQLNRDFAAAFMAYVEEKLAIKETFKDEFYKWLKNVLTDMARFVA